MALVESRTSGRIEKGSMGATLPPLEDLLIEYSCGNAEAFREFFRRTRSIVYGYLRTRLPDGASADDVFQDTYFRVHRYITSFDRSGNAMAWLLRIAHGCLADHLRKRYKSQEVATEQLPEVQVPERSGDILLLKELLAQASSIMGVSDIDLIIERYVQGDSFEEIAERRAWTPTNARQRISRLLRKLKASVES